MEELLENKPKNPPRAPEKVPAGSAQVPNLEKLPDDEGRRVLEKERKRAAIREAVREAIGNVFGDDAYPDDQISAPVGLDDFPLKTGDYALIEFTGKNLRSKLRMGQVLNKKMVQQGHLPELFQVAIDQPEEQRRLVRALQLPHERYQYLYDPFDGKLIFRIEDEAEYQDKIIRKATEEGRDIPKKLDIQTEWVFRTYRNKAEKKTISTKKLTKVR